jgi:hypothetical protein
MSALDRNGDFGISESCEFFSFEIPGMNWLEAANFRPFRFLACYRGGFLLNCNPNFPWQG